MQAVGHVGHRPPVLGAFIEKFGIGRQLKSQPIEPVKFSIHETSKAPRQANLNLIAPIGTTDSSAIDVDKLIVKDCGQFLAKYIRHAETGCQCLLIARSFGRIAERGAAAEARRQRSAQLKLTPPLVYSAVPPGWRRCRLACPIACGARKKRTGRNVLRSSWVCHPGPCRVELGKRRSIMRIAGSPGRWADPWPDPPHFRRRSPQMNSDC